MSITNEIVKFIAGIELDPKDKEAFTKALKESNDICAAFRQEIAETEKEIEKLAKAGKKDSEEFKKLSSQLELTKSKLQGSSKEANKYASILGINAMSYNQLKNHANKLKKEINSLHKESDPELWEKYNDELIVTEKRMKEVRAGAEQSEGVFSKLKTIVKNNQTLFAGLAIAGKTVWAIFQKMTEQTQAWGDGWQVTVAKVKAGWNQLFANIGQGSNVMKASIRDAMEAAGKAQELIDDLFERNNSLRIQEAQTRQDIAKWQNVVNDTTKSAEERLAAMEEILRLEGTLANTKLDIANQENEAALLKLSDARVKLTEDELKTVVNAYNQNYDAFKLAKEYNELLKKREGFEKDLSSSDATSRKLAAAYYEDLTNKMAGYSEATVEYARILRQYNLSNDELVKGYVDAQVHIIEASTEAAEKEASQAEKRSSLKKQMAAEDAQAREDAYNARIKSAEDAYARELIKLKEQLGNREISEAEFRARSFAAEMAMLNCKRAVNLAYGKDVLNIDQIIADKRLEIQKTTAAMIKAEETDTNNLLNAARQEQEAALEALAQEIDALAQELDDLIANDPELSSNPIIEAIEYKNSTSSVGTDAKLADLKFDFDAEMASLENLHEQKLISEEEYLARKKKLTEDYSKQEAEIQAEGWNNALSTAQTLLNGISQAMNAVRDAEYANLDAWKAKELAAAGDNAEKRAQIEDRYEAKKLDIQKKYADVDMGIQLAQAIASGAVAMTQAWIAAAGNPILAGVIMALIGATTTAQIATIIAQRNAIKSVAPGSSGGSTTTRVVNGYSEGGYTGDGGRLEVAGVVHRGEYVVPQPELRDPAVAAMVASIESRRRRRTSANALPGFAEGGYTGATSGGRHTDELLDKILVAIERGNSTPAKAYVVLSDLNEKQKQQSRMNKKSSLRPRP